MDEFIRRYLLLRDGNYTPKESYLVREKKGREKSFLSFMEKMDTLPQLAVEEALCAAVEGNAAVYAEFTFRYDSQEKALTTCDWYLENFFFPLRWAGVLGRAVPIVTLKGESAWLVELFHTDDIPAQYVVNLTPGRLLKGIMDAFINDVPEPTTH